MSKPKTNVPASPAPVAEQTPGNAAKIAAWKAAGLSDDDIATLIGRTSPAPASPATRHATAPTVVGCTLLLSDGTTVSVESLSVKVARKDVTDDEDKVAYAKVVQTLTGKVSLGGMRCQVGGNVTLIRESLGKGKGKATAETMAARVAAWGL